ncbi:CPBP family intramembrane glutamic endopeptidase [Ascidiimonas sp. W6]|uniref:CPBP family intramembrane glutamic endopeptidase n=1 Tax=Ascidiimonas meishanensis TaxID=3128903 RepID=UPI0030ED4B14
MFIEQAYKGTTEIWKYILGVVSVFIGWQFIGAIPLVIALFLKADSMTSIPTDIGGMVDIIGANLFLVLLIISFLGGLIALLFWTKFIHNLSIKSLTTTRNKVDYNRIGFGFAIVIAINLTIFALGYYLTPQDYEWNFNATNFFILALIGIFLLPIQTSFEEYFLRGYMMQGLGVLAKNRWVPLFVTSIFFGLLHAFNPEVEKLGYIVMVYYIGTGFLLGIMTLMDDGLELALGYHAGNNILAALLVTSDWTALQTDSLFIDVSDPKVGLEILTPLVLYAVILFIMGKKYKWSGWINKLFGKVEEPAK